MGELMKRRSLGSSALSVSAIGLGCMGMSQSYGPGDDQESIRTIHRALDLGVTFLDTANVYGMGANERLVGRAIRDRRGEVVLATKFGIVRDPSGTRMSVDGTPANVRASCDASLERLNVDVIDLYYLHRIDPNTPIEETVGAMADLVRAGKVRFLGLSEAAPSNIRRAHKIHPIVALQSEYSLWFREPEISVLPLCRELAIGFVPFSPLGRGFLSGRVSGTEEMAPDDLRRGLPRFTGDNLRRNLGLVRQLEQFAGPKNCTPSQVALAWLLAKGPDIVPIPGTKRRGYLESNAAADDLVLNDEEVGELDAMFAPGAASGDRYAPEMMHLVDRTR